MSMTPMSTHTDDQSLLALPFDHYGRYALTRAIVRIIAETAGGALDALDVGGHSSPLKHFIPEIRVVLSDIEPVGTLTSIDFRFDEYVQASGAALPFRDNAFPVVTAHDTLEHIPPAFREAFLAELARVAGRFVVLTGPVGDEATVRAEARLDSFVRNTLHWDQPFLREHIDLGLPTRASIEEFVQDRGLAFARVANGNIGRWLSLQALRHYFASLPDSEALREALDRSYNTRYPEIDGEGACYRQTYVIATTPDGAAALRAIEAAFPPSNESGGVADIEALTPMLAALEQHADGMQEHLKALHERIFASEQQAFEFKHGYEELAAQMTERNADLLAARQTIEAQRTEIARLRRSLPDKAARAGRRLWRKLVGRR